MLRQARSNTDKPNRGFLEFVHDAGETNTQWVERAEKDIFGGEGMGSEKRDDWSCIALLGGRDTESFRLRVAQAQLRRDLLPSFWSDVILITPQAGSYAAALATHVPLSQPSGKAFPPHENGVVSRPLAHFDNVDLFPNIALIALPIARLEIAQRLETFKRARSTLDALEHVLRWLAFVWGAARTPNPLHENYGIPSACMLETVFASANFDLTPGLESRASCPEAIWSAARYWQDYFQRAIGKVPRGRFHRPHHYSIAESDKPEPAPPPAAKRRARKR
jgi:hypothetical protein